MIRPPRVRPPVGDHTGRRPSRPPGEHPQRPADGMCWPQALHDGAVCLQRTGLLDAMRKILPAGSGVRATEPPWYLGWPTRQRAREDPNG